MISKIDYNLTKSFLVFFLFSCFSITNAQIIKIEDNANNTMFEIHDEGSFGSILIPSDTVPGVTLNKLYNVAGDLHWNGDPITPFWGQNSNDLYYTSGFVGIGIDNPSASLSVYQNALFQNDNTGYTFIDGLSVGVNSTSALISLNENMPLLFATNSGEKMRIDNFGNVGLGTSPNEILEIGGSGRMFIGDGGGSARKGLLIDSYSSGITSLQSFDYDLGQSMPLHINSSGGNVGISAVNPNELLEVGGTGRAFFGDGGGASRKGLLIDGVGQIRLEAYKYQTENGLPLVINTVGGGHVGIGVINPAAHLSIGGIGNLGDAIYAETTGSGTGIHGKGNVGVKGDGISHGLVGNSAAIKGRGVMVSK